MKDSFSSDRELLELAAKACGITFKTLGDAPPAGGGLWVRRDAQGAFPTFEIWNPLKDDGDAFRLIVKLRMHVAWADRGVWTTTSELDSIFKEPNSTNQAAATRRAIVRAAAGLGADTDRPRSDEKNLPEGGTP
jgi:hypothetical protein